MAFKSVGRNKAKRAPAKISDSGNLAILWKSLVEMFEHDHSAARGEMATQQLIIFKHDNKLGNAPAHKLFDLITINRANEDETPARSFSDYVININREGLPKGVKIIME